MATYEALRDLFKAAGEVLQAVDVFELDEIGVFQVLFEQEMVIQVEPDLARGVLVFEGDVGEPPEGSEPRVYPMLLGVNRIWDQTGGLRFAVEPEEGGVTLLWDLSIADLDAERLAGALENFAERMALWSQVVVEGAVETVDERVPAPGVGGGAIRV